MLVGTQFPALKRNKPQLRGTKHSNPNTITGKSFLHKLNYELFNNLPNAMNFLRIKIAFLNKRSLKEVANAMYDRLNLLGKTYKYSQWYHMVIDSIESKLYKEPPAKPKRKAPDNICQVYFSSKAIELINLPSILNNSNLTSILKNSSSNFTIPTVIYNLAPPISSSIFNYKNFLSSTKIDKF